MERISLIKRVLLAVLFAVGLLGASASAQSGGATGGATGGAVVGGATGGMRSHTTPGTHTGGSQTGGAQAVRAQQKTPIQNYSPVTDQRLLNPEPQNWLIYKGNYSQQAYSPLDQINTSNVSNLV
ncbi:MAG TPA: hypothetical protein VF171_08785, partial [Trueperaceae bacterium]